MVSQKCMLAYFSVKNKKNLRKKKKELRYGGIYNKHLDREQKYMYDSLKETIAKGTLWVCCAHTQEG